MKKIIVVIIFSFLIADCLFAQNVGIGTTTPLARFHVTDSSVLFSATGFIPPNPGNTPISGAGRRMMWYPDKAAFRAGVATGDEWDSVNIGIYSTAMGYGPLASGIASTAMGIRTVASGDASTAMGQFSSATGKYSTAIGENAHSPGDFSTSIGTVIFASGSYSTAIGTNIDASGSYSTAMGIASSTNNHKNSFCIGGIGEGYGTPLTENTEDNQMMMRFDNYTFWVSPSSYAYLVPSSNGWAYTSDRNKKERFEELNGDSVLKKIAAIPFYSWNFKDTSSSKYRHYGIMAQDFYNAFGKDSYGHIGNDTTVSALDLIGVQFSAIKALEKRSTSLATENEQLKSNNLALEQQLEAIKNEMAKNNTQIAYKLALLETKMTETIATKQKTSTGKNTVVFNW